MTGLVLGKVILATSLLLLGLGCGAPPDPAAAPAMAERIDIGLHAKPVLLDPHLQSEAGGLVVLSNVYETLVQFDDNLRPEPLLAESWESSSELVWRFHLRPGLRFHDGRELTANDVVSSLERARDLPGSQVAGNLVGISSIRALNEVMTEVTTIEPNPILLNKLAFVFIVPADAPSRIELPVGSGPYRFAGRGPDESILLESFPDYWRDLVSVPDVRFHFLPDQEERLELLLAGELDLVSRLTSASAERVEEAPMTSTHTNRR